MEIERVERLMGKYGDRFTHRLFTERELSVCLPRANAAECLAGRFAAKEAVMKALGTGYSNGVVFSEIEVHGTEGQRPRIILHGRTREVAAERGAGQIHVSITHERTMAVAFVIVESPQDAHS